MSFNFSKRRIYNAIAFRLNRLSGFFYLQHFLKLNNKVFKIPVVNELGKVNIYLKEDWFFKLIKSLKLPEDADFLDIGVNVGQSLLTFRSCYNNSYWGFEPNPACVAYLAKLIGVNSFRNVNIVPVGLSSGNALVKLYARSERDSGATILKELKPGLFKPQDAKYVPVFSFESLGLDIKKIALIKIDVEGAELDVITGMQETIKMHQPVIICEVLDYTSEVSKDQEQNRAGKLAACLREMNYRMYRILHRSKDNLEFEEISHLELRKWAPQSLDLNDYLFLPERITSLPV